MVRESTVQIDQSLVSLAPLETLTIFFMVCLVAGLVLASPWVFYQIWAFVAAGLYRHERSYVTKYLPFSLGLFLAGVFLCFLLRACRSPSSSCCSSTSGWGLRRRSGSATGWVSQRSFR